MHTYESSTAGTWFSESEMSYNGDDNLQEKGGNDFLFICLHHYLTQSPPSFFSIFLSSSLPFLHFLHPSLPLPFSGGCTQAASWEDGEFTYFLFDLEKDPYETTNLYDSSLEAKQKQLELYLQMDRYEKKKKDSGIVDVVLITC